MSGSHLPGEMVRPAIQLHTLRTLDEPLTETLRRVADTIYEGVEFAGLDDESPSTIATTLESTGLEPVGAHVGLNALETDYESTIAAYETLGCERIVVSSYGADEFSSGTISEAADRLSALTDRLADDGFETLYHNHAYEFSKYDDDTIAYDALVAQIDDRLGLEFDTGLARYGGVDPRTYLERYADRCSLVHLTDTIPESDDTLHVGLGEGVVDLDACVDAAADADWLIHENGLTSNPSATLESSATRVKTLLNTV